MAKKQTQKSIETLTHTEASRRHIPTAEYQPLVEQDEPPYMTYPRNRDLDPQLMWRGKDEQDWSELVVPLPPLYIQEKIHPKVLIDDLRRQSEAQAKGHIPQQLDMFADFNGLPNEVAKTEFYQHEANWSNRMILGDSLQVMASLAEREGLRGKVQCIYLDPPYGIKFNSNFQWSTTSRNVTDGKSDHITREPEQVKAFRDTWGDGIHSYLTYLRDRLTVARDLLADSGSIFVQIGDENLHLIKGLLNEVFGENNYVNTIAIKKKGSTLITESVFDFLVWFSRSRDKIKIRRLLELRKSPEEDNKFNTLISPTGEMVREKQLSTEQLTELLDNGWRWARVNYPIVSQDYQEIRSKDYVYRGSPKKCGKNRHWSFDNPEGLERLNRADRIFDAGGSSLAGVVFHEDRQSIAVNNLWDDVKGEENPVYVVQTAWRIAQRCILMITDPGDLVLDPTCGSGTTAYIAEQWGRRWITIDTSRVALALARARIMGARYPYYLLKDSREGQLKEAEISRSLPSQEPTYGHIRHGFVYERVPHITLKAIANNPDIREGLTRAEIDAAIARHAETETLYDQPYQDKKIVRVSGPFTVESLSPHRVLGVDEEDELIDMVAEGKAGYGKGQSFAQMILENLKIAGVQQAHKADKITFSSLTPWPGHYICAEGRYHEGGNEDSPLRRAGIFIGPEFGTVARPDLVAAGREAGETGFDVLIACAFNYDARSTEFNQLGRIPILRARMNADLHMADNLKNTGQGNLFVIFGEPDIDLLEAEGGQIKVRVNGVDVFHPSTGEVRSDGAEGIALWFVDTDYNEESFFVRQAYFLGANDPYQALKTTLKAEINQEAWDSLYSDTSRPFAKPTSGRIAVKVINHLGDEVMKVFKVR